MSETHWNYSSHPPTRMNFAHKNILFAFHCRIVKEISPREVSHRLVGDWFDTGQLVILYLNFRPSAKNFFSQRQFPFFIFRTKEGRCKISKAHFTETSSCTSICITNLNAEFEYSREDIHRRGKFKFHCIYSKMKIFAKDNFLASEIYS